MDFLTVYLGLHRSKQNGNISVFFAVTLTTQMLNGIRIIYNSDDKKCATASIAEP